MKKVIFLLLLLPFIAMAQIPQTMTYQGVLTDNTGQNVADDTYSVVFEMFTVNENGVAVWTETQNVTTEDGIFNVVLGTVTPISGIDAAGPLYLQLTVAGDVLAPRTVLASNIRSFSSKGLENTADAGTSAITAINSGTGQIAYARLNLTNSIVAGDIAGDAVGASEIAADAVAASEIAADAVGASEISADAVGTSEIAANAVGNSEMADNAIGSAEIANGSVATADMAAGGNNTMLTTNGSGTVGWTSFPPNVTYLRKTTDEEFDQDDYEDVTGLDNTSLATNASYVVEGVIRSGNYDGTNMDLVIYTSSAASFSTYLEGISVGTSVASSESTPTFNNTTTGTIYVKFYLRTSGSATNLRVRARTNSGDSSDDFDILSNSYLMITRIN